MNKQDSSCQHVSYDGIQEPMSPQSLSCQVGLNQIQVRAL